MTKENKYIKELEKKLDEQWGVTNHYIVWKDWVKDMLRDALKSQRKEIIEKIEKSVDACDGGEDCKCTTEMSKNVSIGRYGVKNEIINLIKEDE